ncbi:hypothetical protein BU16DRAFT_186029 [Lophium mytilinum]|uniref:Uncharacterized protein n=1 Tax=Lophium mytilinum TaxID=390894 RepID=A0A6A6R978_9PEZI|nr:hypothetical protein BU16DRAFT_186029 [Lophium mytilinum]
MKMMPPTAMMVLPCSSAISTLAAVHLMRIAYLQRAAKEILSLVAGLKPNGVFLQSPKTSSIQEILEKLIFSSPHPSSCNTDFILVKTGENTGWYWVGCATETEIVYFLTSPGEAAGTQPSNSQSKPPRSLQFHYLRT